MSRSRFVRWLSLQPFGEALLTEGARFWIASARLLVLLMALAEAIAWGYVGSLISPGWPLLTAAIAGSFVFILIWIIDTSLMTIDFSRASDDDRAIRRTERMKIAAGLVARIGIVAASLTVTAPFLAQAVLSRDISAEMQQRNAVSVAAARDALERDLESRIESLRQEERDLQRERVAEAAGAGPSGRHGRGPAVETIERQIADKQAGIAAAISARDRALDAFDRLTPEELQRRHGVEIVAPGIRSSALVLDEMVERSQYSRVEIAVAAFLVLLFLGLLILKLFQPRSVAIYFSERLQSLHAQYRTGAFDRYLPVGERAAAGGSIDALRFEQWVTSTWDSVVREEDRRRDVATSVRASELRLEQWQTMEERIRRELEPVAQHHDAMREAVAGLEEELRRTRGDLSAAAGSMKEIDASRASLRRQLERGGNEGSSLAHLLDALHGLDQRAATIEAAIREDRRKEEKLAARLDRDRAEADTKQHDVERRRAIIDGLRQRIDEERMALAAALAR